jgi:DNA-binding response OmpR family regulator
MVTANQSRVLVVEADADTADSYATLLRLWGFDVQACYDAETALAIACRYRPQVVLLDIALPRMNGFQVALRLRKQAGTRRPVCIAISGYANEAYRLRSREVGIHHYLVKPVSPDFLHELLMQVVGHSSFFRTHEVEEGL